MAFDQYKNITGAVPESLDTPKTDLARLFEKAAPDGWKPKIGEQVYMRPGLTIGGSRLDRVSVVFVLVSTATVEMQIGRRRKRRVVLLADLRPITGTTP